MTEFINTAKSYCIFKDDLPTVRTNNKGQPFVMIPDPDNPGETIHFISLPGDAAADLYNLAAAYLALAQNLERNPNV